ncbi:MAG TPA: LLM class flavin-dependent oxidoreductase [Acidimicrobiales bacterium]|jgi:alkanesulfonate monooxygenase SsuD/methylene tetrahydromethanopterin reductase-like flavin-dependent oxidoreductase (luciferase family)
MQMTTDYGLVYDMRAPAFGAPATELYRAAIEQCAWADQHGFSRVTFPEHHASDDGYLPSPIVMAAAVAGVTQQMLIHLSVVLLPLYHPLRAAEDLAVLDLVSGGRLRLTVAGGYREEEYEQFGLDIRRRPSLMERAVAALKDAWTGEPFEFDGRTVRILPRPAQEPRPDIFLGGASPATAKRAARIAEGYEPLGARLYEIYLDEVRALGRPEPKSSPPSAEPSPLFLHVSDDPERDWPVIAPHALYEANAYGKWVRGRRGAVYAEATDAEELRQSGMYRVVTPDECVELARRTGRLTFKPLMGGLDPKVGWEGLHRFVDDVLPRLNGTT